MSNATRVAPPDDRLDGPVHEYFELSYANYLVVHRTLMQSMPPEWQERIVACLRELDAAFDHVEKPPGFDIHIGSWWPANECSDADLARAGAERYYVDADGETIPAEKLKDDAVYDAAEERFAWRGDEVDGYQRIFVPYPAGDPVPHYNRGRTYVPPAGAPS
jgi:hypothetical protein